MGIFHMRLAVLICTVNLFHLNLASDIECISIEKCPFAHRVVKRTGTQNAPFFIDVVCGYDEKANAKIWCNKFLDCKTPENKNGTCISLDHCAHFANLDPTNSNTRRMSEKIRCNRNTEKKVYVCCPSPSDQEVYSNKDLQERIQRYPTMKVNRRLDITPSVVIKRKKRHFPDSSSWQSSGNFDHKHDHRFFGNEEDHFQFPRPPSPWPHGRFHLIPRKHTPEFHNKIENSDESNDDFSISSEEAHHLNANRNNIHFKGHFIDWDEHNHFPDFPKPFPNANKDIDEDNVSNKADDCTTANGLPGYCMPIPQCKQLHVHNEQINIHDKPKFVCTHLKHMCCPNDDNVKSKDHPHSPRRGTKNNSTKTFSNDNPGANVSFTLSNNNIDEKKLIDTFKAFENICGTHELNDRILGGTTTDLGEFPWLALFQYSGRNGLSYGCAGSLITDSVVVSAAHCVDSKILKQKSLGNLFKVVLGEYDTRNATDCFYMKYGTNCANPAEYFGIDKIKLHEMYQNRESSTNDIALVKLDRTVLFTDFIRPICLPDIVDSGNSVINKRVVISGWGRTETEQMSPVKRKANLQVVSNNQCNRNLNENNISMGQMCLSGVNGTDSCNGDSGGPVMLEQRNRSGKLVFTVEGIISFGFRPCGQFPSVATNVSHYLRWIRDNVIL